MSSLSPTRRLAGLAVDLGLIVQLEVLPLDRAAQPVLHGHARHHRRGQLQPVMQVFLAGGLGAAQRALGVLHQCVGVVAVVGIAREAALHVDGNAARIHGERRTEDFHHLLLHPVHGLVLVARRFHDDAEGPGTEVRQ